MKKVLPLVLFAGILVASYYLIFSRKEFENNKVSLSEITKSEEQKYLEKLDIKEIERIVFSTLPDKIFKPEFAGKIFCSNHLYGYESDINNKKVNIYLYAYCEEYYLKGENVILGSGVSLPLKLVFKIDKESLLFDSLDKAKEGSEYQSSLKEIFPEKYINEIKSGINVSELVPSPKVQAENYFKGKLEVYF